MEKIGRQYWWKGWRQDVKRCIRTCPSCQVNKLDNRLLQGKLQLIPVPQQRWEVVATDLVTDLPISEGYDAVVVFMDKLSKMIHLAPCTKTIDAPTYAELFFTNVFRLHGLPQAIISDHDPRFLSTFWKALWKLMGTSLRMCSSYHPESYDQSE